VGLRIYSNKSEFKVVSGLIIASIWSYVNKQTSVLQVQDCYLKCWENTVWT